MDEPLLRQPWAYSLIYVGFALALLFVRMLPLGSDAGQLPGPDLLLCVTLSWVLRRPDYLPVGLIAMVVLLEDLVLMRPPGLWAALVVLATEFLRSRAALTRELIFPVEWALVAALMLGAMFLHRLVMMIAILPQPSFGFALIQIVGSILCYPLVVGVSRFALGVRKPATGELDAMGRRL